MNVQEYIGKLTPLENRHICMNRKITPKIYNFIQILVFFSSNKVNIPYVKQHYSPSRLFICEDAPYYCVITCHSHITQMTWSMEYQNRVIEFFFLAEL